MALPRLSDRMALSLVTSGTSLVFPATQLLPQNPIIMNLRVSTFCKLLDITFGFGIQGCWFTVSIYHVNEALGSYSHRISQSRWTQWEASAGQLLSPDEENSTPSAWEMYCFNCVSVKKGKCVLAGEEINRQKLFDRIVKTAIEEKKKPVTESPPSLPDCTSLVKFS